MGEVLPFAAAKTYGEDGPDPIPMLWLHRADDGFVRLFYRPHPEDENLEVVPHGSFRAGKLMAMFPEVIEYLTRDAYYTINAFYRGGTSKTEHLRYLNACFIDLDHGKDGVTPGKAFGMVLEAIDTGVIPKPSVFVRSGRGTWLFYILRDPNHPDRGQRVHSGGKELRLFLSINAEIHRRLALHYPDLQPDGGALDASRLTRVPGSINTKAMQYVTYLPWIEQDGVIPSYTLYELADLLELDAAKRSPYPPRPKSATSVPKRRGGQRAMKEAMLAEFEVLRAARGGFREGHRNNAVLILASILRGLYSKEEVLAEVIKLGQECRDDRGIKLAPLPEDECRRAVESVYKKGYRHGYASMARKLGVSPDEESYLGLEKLSINYKSTTGRNYERKTDANKIELRRHAIRVVIEENGGRVPSIRKMRSELKKRGHPASIGTISTDYKVLGLTSEAAKQRDPGDRPEPLPFDRK